MRLPVGISSWVCADLSVALGALLHTYRSLSMGPPASVNTKLVYNHNIWMCRQGTYTKDLHLPFRRGENAPAIGYSQLYYPARNWEVYQPHLRNPHHLPCRSVLITHTLQNSLASVECCALRLATHSPSCSPSCVRCDNNTPSTKISRHGTRDIEIAIPTQAQRSD